MCRAAGCPICYQLHKSFHFIDMVRFLAARLQRGEQLLCFLTTTKEVNSTVELLRNITSRRGVIDS